MPLTSAFTPPGHFAFSSKPAHGQSIYETLRANFGDVFLTDFDGSLQQARLYAQAMCLASSQYQLDRALNNRTPEKATELLGVLEHDYQVIPSPRSTLEQRRAYLTAFQQVTRGNRREAMEDALRTLLGSDFLEYRTTQRADIVTTPANPGTVGVFAAAGAKKKVFRLNAAIYLTGVEVECPITPMGGTEFPLAGETYCVDPDPRRNIEQILVTDAAGPPFNTITTTFTKSHEFGTLAARPHPYWISNQRVDTVVVTLAAATDPETRRKINEIMARLTRGVSQWSIINDLGVFTPDVDGLDLPDIVPLS